MRSAAQARTTRRRRTRSTAEPDETTGPLLDTVLTPLYAAYACGRRRATSARRSISICRNARSCSSPTARVDRVIAPERLDAHRLIEEFMILANVAAAETLEARVRR